MKKGFTIVEIIISVSILLIVGTSTTFFVLKRNYNKELISITNEILEAANLYANKEVDENGKIYLSQVRSGKKGIKIPLDNLVKKGYIDEKLKNDIIELSNKGNDYNYYIMLLQGSGESIDYCEDGSIVSIASWIESDKDKDIYLCNSGSITDGLKNDPIKRFIEDNIIIEKSGIPNKDWYNYEYIEAPTPNYEVAIFSYPKENGLIKVEYGEYYYRGSVENNYVNFNNLKFRILSFNENYKEIRLISEDPIDKSFYTSGNDLIDYALKGIKNWYYSSILYNFYHPDENIQMNFEKIVKVDTPFCVQEKQLKSVETTYLFTTPPYKFQFTPFFIDKYAGCNSFVKNEGVGLITLEEAVYSGVFVDVLDYNGYSGASYSKNTWITSNGGLFTPTLNGLNPSYYYLYISKHGIINSIYFSDLYYTELFYNSIRPVIVLDANYISFSGTGTKGDPYVFYPKGFYFPS